MVKSLAVRLTLQKIVAIGPAGVSLMVLREFVMRYLILVFSIIFPTFAYGQNFNGLCIDNVEVGCMDRYLPFDVRSVNFCEATCTLTNPINVRDLTATLFDFECLSDNGNTKSRVMVLDQIDYDGKILTLMIDKNQTRQIVQCP